MAHLIPLLILMLLAKPQSLQICYFNSSASPADLAEAVVKRQERTFAGSGVYNRDFTVNSRVEVGSELVEGCDLIVDGTGDGRMSAWLGRLCVEENVGLVSFSSSLPQVTSTSLSTRQRNQSVYLDSILRHFNWTSVSLLYNSNMQSLGQYADLQEKYNVREVLVPENASRSNIQKILIREIKQFGSTVLCVATALNTTKEVLSALRDEQMLKAGYAVIVVGEAVWEEQIETFAGLLLLREEDCMAAQSLWECNADLVTAFIVNTGKQFNIPVADLTREAFTNYLSSRSPGLIPKYVLINTQSHTNQVVGRFDSTGRDLKQTGRIYYPGNILTSPSDNEGIIEISINSGIANPTHPPASNIREYYLGQPLAVQQLNLRRDILPRNTLISYDMSFGATEWNESWATPRILANREKLGLVHMGGYSSVVVTNTMNVFAKHNLSRPVMGSLNTLMELSNSTNYPWYLRNGISALVFAGLFTNILPEIGWRKCAVLYGDDVWGINMYETFKELANYRHTEILNNETLRKITGYGSKATIWSDHRSSLLELFRCNARVVIIFCLEPIPQYILELMFDLGARRGDFIFTGAWVTSNYFESGTPLNIMKRKELLEGTVGIVGASWIGTYGAQVKKDISAAFNQTDPSLFECLYYDSTLTIAYALQMCMQLGLDYTNPTQLMKIMRQTRFTGCSGFISWLSGSNDRAYHEYSIVNMVKDKVSGNYSLREVGYYRPTSALLLNFTVPFIYPDGSAVIPSDLRVKFEDCPFENKLLRDFPAGKHLTMGVFIIIAGLTTILAVLIYKKLWRVKVTPIKRSELSVEDVIFMGTIGVEAVQLAVLGPDFLSLNSSLNQIAQQLSVDFRSTMSYTNGVYWIAVNITFGVIVSWGLLNVFTCLRLEERCKKSNCCSFLGEIAYISLPLLGNICFIPIISVLMDVYVCDQVVGYGSLGYGSSILAKDCYVDCWSQTHIIYMVFASLSLICYIPSAILLRPVWQDYQNNLHIRSHPLFLVVKSILQVTLVCLSKTLKRWYPIAHSAVYLVIITTFGVFLCVKPAYNYKRVNLWQVLSCVGVFELSLIAILNDFVYHHSDFKLVFLICILWLLLISTLYTVFGLISQAIFLPSFLYRKTNRDIKKVLRFAFTSNVSVSEIQPRLNLVRNIDISTHQSSQDCLEPGGRGLAVRRVPTMPRRAVSAG